MAAAVAPSKWRTRRRRIYQSVFQTDISQPTPYSTPTVRSTGRGQPFGGHLPVSELNHQLHHASHTHAASPNAAPGTLQPLPGQRNTGDVLYQRDVVAASFASPQPPATGHFGQQDPAEDQMRYDRAWHVVTSRIALPASATAEDSFGTLAPDSQFSQGQGVSSEPQFYEALRLVVDAPTALPRAAHTEDILFWHTQQVRRHFAQHVLPLLSACAEGLLGEEDLRDPTGGGSYEKHMIIVMSSVRTLEAAMRLYSYGMQLLVRGIQRFQAVDKENAATDPELIAGRFRRDVHSLVSNSASPQLIRSLRVVLVHLVGNTLGVPAKKHGGKGDAETVTVRPVPPTDNDLGSLAARKRLLELLEPLYSVGLAGERFQILFAEVMDSMMSDFVKGAYAGVWAPPSEQHGLLRSTSITGLQATSLGSSSPCIVSLCDWVENHYARLAIEVLSRITDDTSQPPVTLSDVKTYQSLALGRLAALRISELFDIVLAWPSSAGALDDLRAAITTPARRLQLTDTFAVALQRRLLHPGRSSLEILQTYIAMIRTFHALDHSKVLLSRVSPSLQLYLCGREDAVRIVVTGLLASPEEIRAARMEKQMREEKEGMTRGSRQARTARAGAFMTPALPPRRGLRSRHGTPDVEEAGIRDVPPASSAPTAGATHSTKLVELALLMTDPVQSRRAGGADEDADLDWNDMSWVPDPIDAGANYKRPRSEDVIGTLISALGSQDTFIREFQVIVAERLLSDQARFDQEVRVLNLLKKRFGEAALQNCDVMIRDIQDSRRLDGAIRKVQGARGGGEQPRPPQPAATPTNPKTRSRGLAPSSSSPPARPAEAPYHARILSRLFWPNLEREHFLLPTPISEQQKHYEQGYEHLKSSRKLTWLNQLGQATVELELQDRTVTVDCKTYETTVIYAFESSDASPARRTVSDLEEQLQMDDDLISSALSFWVSKGILARRGDVYTVLETASSSSDQPPSPNPASPSSPETAEAAAPAPPPAIVIDEKEAARRAVYWQYIRGMLTNAAASMPLGQMAMMMKMLIADGFPWSNEELQEFLAEKVGEGELEIVGGKYRLVKK